MVDISKATVTESSKFLKVKRRIFFSVTGEISGGFGRADSDEDDGPMIPDLDDVQDEDMALQVTSILF